jgi:hypothetical protein
MTITSLTIVYASAGLYAAYRLSPWRRYWFLIAAFAVMVLGAYMIKLGWIQ